jgi:signal transduction histidine kinase
MHRHTEPVLTPASGDRDELRMTSGTRVLLAAAAFVITRLDPSEPSRFAEVTYLILFGYLFYAIALYLTVLKVRDLPLSLQHALHWIDVTVYATLIGLSGGSNSVFFVLLFFAILVASFRWGFAAGVGVTLGSLVLFVIVTLVTNLQDGTVEINRFLVRTSSLPLLGYLIASRGGYELRLRQRVALLRDLSAVSNPRLGRDYLLTAALERLRQFYDADVCLSILPSRREDGYELCRTQRGMSGTAERSKVPKELVSSLLVFGANDVYYRRGSRWRRTQLSVFTTSLTPDVTPLPDESHCRTVTDLLNVSTFVSVPLRLGMRPLGRVFLADRSRQFDRGDCRFLLQAANQLMPMLDYVDLVDRMATRAAHEERQRIALDIHDQIIQSYAAVQMGVAALRHLLERFNGASVPAGLSESVDKLHALTSQGLGELRSYVKGLRLPKPGDGLAESLRRFSELFGDATGMTVNVRIADDISLEEDVAAEIFSMVTEGVSNVRRHTNAMQVDIELAKKSDRLVLRIQNPVDDGARPAGFVPRSISQRAASLRGAVRIEATSQGDTAVIVEIPLS